MILDHFKVDPEKLPDFMEGRVVIGRTVSIDGDALCYRVTAGCAKLETAHRRFITGIYEIMFLTGAEFARVHLTPKGCQKNERHLLLPVKPYQGNRTNKPKPPLLEPLRDTAASLFDPKENITVYAHYDVEADDAIMRDAYLIENLIVWSEDKDLQIVPCELYNIQTGIVSRIQDRFGYIKLIKTDSGKDKIKGHGTKFFWTQMLMGDTADNVKGIEKYNGKLCGLVAAYNTLVKCPSEPAAANLVLDGYRAIDQNPIPEGECLWLSRCVGDSFAGYVWSLELSDDNREFIQDCFNRKYKITQEEYDCLTQTQP